MSKPTAWSGKKYGENKARVRCPDELLAEADMGDAIAREGSCPHRRWELLYRAPSGTADHYHLRSIDVACPVHKTRPGEPCR